MRPSATCSHRGGRLAYGDIKIIIILHETMRPYATYAHRGSRLAFGKIRITILRETTTGRLGQSLSGLVA